MGGTDTFTRGVGELGPVSTRSDSKSGSIMVFFGFSFQNCPISPPPPPTATTVLVLAHSAAEAVAVGITPLFKYDAVFQGEDVKNGISVAFYHNGLRKS